MSTFVMNTQSYTIHSFIAIFSLTISYDDACAAVACLLYLYSYMYKMNGIIEGGIVMVLKSLAPYTSGSLYKYCMFIIYSTCSHSQSFLHSHVCNFFLMSKYNLIYFMGCMYGCLCTKCLNKEMERKNSQAQPQKKKNYNNQGNVFNVQNAKRHESQ